MNNSILSDFRRLFQKEGTRFDVDEFVEYARGHYFSDYNHIKTSYISKKLAEEHFAQQEQQQVDK